MKLIALAVAVMLAVGAGGIAAADYAHTPIDGVSSVDYDEKLPADEVEQVSVEDVEQVDETIVFETADGDVDTHEFTTDEVELEPIDDENVEEIERIPAEELKEMSVDEDDDTTSDGS